MVIVLEQHRIEFHTYLLVQLQCELMKSFENMVVLTLFLGAQDLLNFQPTLL